MGTNLEDESILEEDLLFRVENNFMSDSEVCRFRTLAEDALLSTSKERRRLSQKSIRLRYNDNIRSIDLNDHGEIYCEIKKGKDVYGFIIGEVSECYKNHAPHPVLFFN